MVTKDLQTLNLKFDQVMFNSLVLTWEINFEVTFGIFSVLIFQINVLEYLKLFRYLSVLKLVMIKNVKIVIIRPLNQCFSSMSSLPERYSTACLLYLLGYKILIFAFFRVFWKILCKTEILVSFKVCSFSISSKNEKFPEKFPVN